MHRRGTLVAIVIAVVGFWFPGIGPGLVGRHRAMLLWVAVMAASILAVAISIWLLPLAVAVRFAAAAGGFRAVRAADRDDVPSSVPGLVIAILLNLAAPLAIRIIALEAFKMPSSSMSPTLNTGDHVFADKLTPRLGDVQRGELIVFIQPCEPDRDYLKRVIALAGDTVEVRCNKVYVNGAPLAEELVQGYGCTYRDRNESSGEWYTQRCSEYREALGTHHYHVYHDANRPTHDVRRDPPMSGDTHDFPQLDGLHEPPHCAPGPRVPAGQQAPGSIVQTRQGAGPCEPQLHYVVPAGHVFAMGDNRSNSNDSRYWGSVPRSLIKGRVIGIWLSATDESVSFSRFGSVE
jgi:signal peptidase I